MFKKGDVVVFTEERKKKVLKNAHHYQEWYVYGIEDDFTIIKVNTNNFALVKSADDYRQMTVWLGDVQKKEQPLLVTIEMLRDDVAQLQQENEQLKQRLIEAERNALYWTAFDCPVNRDIAERILRKEN